MPHAHTCACNDAHTYIGILRPLKLVEQLCSKHGIEILPNSITHLLDLTRTVCAKRLDLRIYMCMYMYIQWHCTMYNVHVCVFVYMYMYMYGCAIVCGRDNSHLHTSCVYSMQVNEDGKRSKTKQHTRLRQHFQGKSCTQTHTSHIVGMIFYQLSYWGSSAGCVQITYMYIHVHVQPKQSKHLMYMYMYMNIPSSTCTSYMYLYVYMYNTWCVCRGHIRLACSSQGQW